MELDYKYIFMDLKYIFRDEWIYTICYYAIMEYYKDEINIMVSTVISKSLSIHTHVVHSLNVLVT